MATPLPTVEDYFDFSELAYDLTGSGSNTTPVPTNWYVLPNPAIDPNGLTAIAFRNDVTKQIVVAYRGSVTGHDWIVADGEGIALGLRPLQFATAEAFAKNLLQTNPGYTLFVTGHSLGGAEAEDVADALDVGGDTFAAPGVSNMLTAPPIQGPQTPAQILTDYIITTDPVGNYATDTNSSPTPNGSHIGTVVPLQPIFYLSNILLAGLLSRVTKSKSAALFTGLSAATSHLMYSYGQALVAAGLITKNTLSGSTFVFGDLSEIYNNVQNIVRASDASGNTTESGTITVSTSGGNVTGTISGTLSTSGISTLTISELSGTNSASQAATISSLGTVTTNTITLDGVTITTPSSEPANIDFGADGSLLVGAPSTVQGQEITLVNSSDDSDTLMLGGDSSGAARGEISYNGNNVTATSIALSVSSAGYLVFGGGKFTNKGLFAVDPGADTMVDPTALVNDDVISIGSGSTLDIAAPITSDLPLPSSTASRSVQSSGVYYTAQGQDFIGADNTKPITWTGTATAIGAGNWAAYDGTMAADILAIDSNDLGSSANFTDPTLTALGAPYHAVGLGMYTASSIVGPPFSRATELIAYSFSAPIRTGTSFFLWDPGSEVSGYDANGKFVFDNGPFPFTFSATLGGVPVSTAGWSFSVESPFGLPSDASYSVNAATGTVVVNNYDGSGYLPDRVIVATPNTAIDAIQVIANVTQNDFWGLAFPLLGPQIQIGDGSTLELTSTVDASETVIFGQNSILKLDNPQGFSGTVENFRSGDQIDITNIGTVAGVSGFSNGILTVRGPALTESIKFGDYTNLSFFVASDGSSGVDIGTRGTLDSNDFSGDGTSDILWRNSVNGQVNIFQMSNGQIAANTDLGDVDPTRWQIAGTGYFYGPGTSGVLWRNSVNGQVNIFQMSNGQIAANTDLGNVDPTQWQIAGTGDFYGPGTSDILWRNSVNGQVNIFQMSNGQIAANTDLGDVDPTQWQIAGTGDFYGTGTDDILLHNSVNGQVNIFKMSNGQIVSNTDLGNVAPTQWQITGVGDFYGTGTDDILLRNSVNGQVNIWHMSNGQIVSNTDLGDVDPTQWRIAGVGDFYGTGTDDILLRNAVNGQVNIWQMSNGQIAANTDLGDVDPTQWQTNQSGGDLVTVPAGNATIYAVGGNDVFDFSAGTFGNDTVVGFNDATDAFKISHTLAANFAAVQANKTASGSNTLITFNASHSILVTGVSPSYLAAGNFQFV